MKKKLFAGLLAAIVALSGCTIGGSTRSEEPGTESLSEGIPVTEDTIENAGISAFIKLPDYKGIELTRKTEPVTEEELNEVIQQDLNTYRIGVPDLPIQDLFWVEMDYAGTIDGQAFDGSAANNYALKIGTGMFPTEFEAQLIGHKQGEQVGVRVTFPEDYTNRDIAGKTAIYDVNILKVSVALGEPTQDWLNIYFGGMSVDDYLAQKRAELAAGKSSDSDSALLTDAWYKVFDQAEVLQYPKNLLDTWIKYSEDTYARYAASYNMSYEEFLEEYGVSAASIERNAREYSKTWMVATAIMQSDGIEPGSDAYNAKRSELLKSSGYPSEDAATAAGVSEENIDMTTRYYLAAQIIFDNAVITDNPSEG